MPPYPFHASGEASHDICLETLPHQLPGQTGDGAEPPPSLQLLMQQRKDAPRVIGVVLPAFLAEHLHLA